MFALDNQPIKITTQFSGSDVTGQHEHPVDSDITEEVKTTRSNHLKFRVTLQCIHFKKMILLFADVGSRQKCWNYCK